ncbi:iron ABC transporter permease [Fusibacter sp. 3D3]|uniref:ABC transporter permease n=1 Tax=Fusibacter sp. 3D3 TaxID=1048380 RepID=UPI000853E077|nr:iron ABC transporter permease [Fusibacter sp. 3D3]GAU79671.1 ferric iron ABC transporter, permease protein [Fusibacter sp. 3D3]
MEKLHHKSSFLKVAVISLLLWSLVGFILYPVLKTFQVSLITEDGLSIRHYIHFFNTQSYVIALKNSIILGVLTVVVCGFIGTLLAFLVHFFEMPFRKTIDKLLLLPIVLPGLVIVFAFVQLYGESGLVTKTIQTLQTLLGLDEIPFKLSGLSGILFIHAYTQYIYFYVNVSIAIRHIDRYTIEAARNLGATKWQILTTIILPFIKPAIIASSIITFMTGIGSFSAPSIIGGSYKVMTTQILLSKANNYMDIAATQVIILTFVSFMFLGVMRHYENKCRFESSVKGVGIKPQKINNPVVKMILMILAFSLVLFILLPIVTVFMLSFVKPGTWMIEIYPKEFSMANYIKIFTKSRSLAPFINSFIMALLTAILCIAIATPASYIIVKTKFKFKIMIEALIMMPWAIPASAIAINMINAFNHPTPFTGNQILVGEYILLPIAYFVSQVPLMFRTTTISFQNLNNTFIEASKSLRGSSFQTIRKVVLPIITPGIMGGTMLIVIRSIGEYTISTYLYTVQNKPISIAMVNGIFEYEIGLAMAYGALVVVFALVASVFISKIPKY